MQLHLIIIISAMLTIYCEERYVEKSSFRITMPTFKHGALANWQNRNYLNKQPTSSQWMKCKPLIGAIFSVVNGKYNTK